MSQFVGRLLNFTGCFQRHSLSPLEVPLKGYGSAYKKNEVVGYIRGTPKREFLGRRWEHW